MKARTYLLATASGVAAAAAAGGVQAADMPMKAAPAPIPPAAPSWTGFYIGGNLGAAWQQSHFQGNGYDVAAFESVVAPPLSNSNTSTTFIGGGQVGYLFQSGSGVYGLEADISGLGNHGGSSSQAFSVGKGSVCSPCTANTSSRIDWVATFRPVLGLAFTDTMVYATAGLAVGRVNNSFTQTGNYGGGTFSVHSTKTGLAVGGGVRHMLSPNWIVGLEALFIDLGHSTATGTLGSFKTTPFSGNFSNQMVVGRVRLDYKF
jgi:outer membrane immunogenic protein